MEIKERQKVTEFQEIVPESVLSLIGFKRIATLNMNDSIQGNQCCCSKRRKEKINTRKRGRGGGGNRKSRPRVLQGNSHKQSM